jgi:predicted DNA-binding transcriptional regulator AlpA
LTKRRNSGPPAAAAKPSDDKPVRLTPAEAEQAAALLGELHDQLGDVLRAKRLEMTAELMALNDTITACFTPRGVAGQRAATTNDAAAPAPPTAPTDPVPSALTTMSRADVARLLRTSVSTIQRMEKDGRLPKPIKTGPRSRRHLVKDVNALLERLEAERDSQQHRRDTLH